MVFGIIFLPAAATDIRAIYDWYEEQKAGLGKEFTQAVIQQAEDLSKDIVDHRFFIEPVRYVKMKIFPYSIFYIKDEQIRQ